VSTPEPLSTEALEEWLTEFGNHPMLALDFRLAAHAAASCLLEQDRDPAPVAAEVERLAASFAWGTEERMRLLEAAERLRHPIG